ncbi:MAG: TIGR03013 family PEP-CTERM/XrtA system glycosyltransferase [Desulfobacula sp.]|uniref:TIGR03013 family XrtA/PEP-CTERM system glycosyltransferase n=1 Tax=Desulfobacula sp. TaxID=2593537 RepID=UPI0025C34B05|nr:TIGR03013 family XrtA/PEP-CTERM system glycosyltransferase [Desulfobacula sp.]MCD4721083.1 TIGR03013 family PEP-CTERM/XrtA system glycosyltransferase [Desulfobacula sp.]
MLRVLKQYFPIRNILFFLSEGLFIFGSVFLSALLLTNSASFLFDLILFLKIFLITVICQICLYYNDLYDFEIASSIPEVSIRLLQALGVTSIALAIIYFFLPVAIIDQKVFILSVLFLLVFIIGWRIGYIWILNKGFFNESIIILGSTPLAFDIINTINNTIDCGYNVALLIPDSDKDDIDEAIAAKPTIDCNRESFCSIALGMGAKKVVVALKEKRGAFPTKELLNCRTEGLEVLEGSTFYEMLTGKLLVTKINPSWLIFSEGFKKTRLKTFVKRVEDIIISSIMLILLSPLLLLTTILIKLTSKGPVFFSQDRVGQNQKEYMMHKFRSMIEDAEKQTGPVWAQTDDNRITRVGKIIRKFRIDELPQLWDVLMGKMSMVGPRPERKYFTDELEKQIPYYTERFKVKPGLTGWAQVSYDYGATVEDAIEKLNYDLFYIKNLSITMDLVIIIRTVKTVLFGRGAR